MPLSPAQAALARWLAIVPAAALSWLAGLAAGLGLLTIAERLCPREAMVSGMCTAPWYAGAEAAILCVSTALAAALMVGAAAWLAPSRKIVAAAVVLALGSLYALASAWGTGEWAAGASAFAAGAATFWLATRRAT